MAYKTKTHTHHYTGKYWQERELREMREKYKGKLPPYSVIGKETIRIMEEEPKRIHQKNRLVYYKDELAVVDKTSRKGVWIKKLGKNAIETEGVSKPIFIPEEKAEQQLRAVQPKVPAYVQPLFVYG